MQHRLTITVTTEDRNSPNAEVAFDFDPPVGTGEASTCETYAVAILTAIGLESKSVKVKSMTEDLPLELGTALLAELER